MITVNPMEGVPATFVTLPAAEMVGLLVNPQGKPTTGGAKGRRTTSWRWTTPKWASA